MLCHNLCGLPQIWRVFEFQDVATELRCQNIDEPVYLELKDHMQVFSILVIGYVLSSIALLVEIMFYGFLKKVKKLKVIPYQFRYRRTKLPKDVRYQKGALYYIIHRHQKLKRLHPKIRKVCKIFAPKN